MKRRHFLNKVKSTTIIGLSYPLLSFEKFEKKLKKITILHTNDVHSHIDPFPKNDPLNPNGGGVIPRANLINVLKKENPNTLVLDAGDVFQGTPYYNFFGGEIELKLMSKMGYSASTLGNHEFDSGLDKLAKSLKHANFSFLNSNYTLKNTALENKIKEYEIFEIDGVKIGVFGLGIELDGLVEKNLYNGIKYLDPIEITQDITNKLKNYYNCDIIICLSHLGYNYNKKEEIICDLILAKNDSYAYFWESIFILHQKRYKISQVSVSLPFRQVGESKISFKDIFFAIYYLLLVFIKKLFGHYDF